MVIIDQPQKKSSRYSSPPQLRYPQLRYFQGSKKTQVKLFSSKLHYFSPLLQYFLLFPPRYAPFYVLEEKIV